jgi:hypothetical protein
VEGPRQGQLLRIEDLRPATAASPSPGRLQAGLSPFADQIALELRQSAKDVEDELAAAGGRVDRLLEAGP